MAAFDVQAAREAGYSSGEIAEFLAAQRNFDLAGARSAGYSDDELLSFLADTTPPRGPLDKLDDVRRGMQEETNANLEASGAPSPADKPETPGVVSQVGSWLNDVRRGMQDQTNANLESGGSNATAPSTGSVMDGYAPAAKIEGMGAPVSDEVFSRIKMDWEAATPEARRNMEALPGWRGSVAKTIAQQYSEMTPAAEPFDPRFEARRLREIRAGAAPEVADNMAATRADGGSIKESDFDFDTRNEYRDANPVVRGAMKGLSAYEKGALGTLQAVAELTGADFAAGQFQRGAERAEGRITAIGQGDAATRHFEGAVASIVQQLPGMLGGAVTGSTALALGTMGVQSFGQEYADGRAAGLEGTDAAQRAGLFAAFEIIGERFGLGNSLSAIRGAMDGVPTGQLVEELGKALAKEIPGESLTTTGQFLTDKVPAFGLNQEAGWAEYLGQMSDTVIQTVMQGGMMMGGTAAASAAVRALPQPDTAGAAVQALAPGNAQLTVSVPERTIPTDPLAAAFQRGQQLRAELESAPRLDPLTAATQGGQQLRAEIERTPQNGQLIETDAAPIDQAALLDEVRRATTTPPPPLSTGAGWGLQPEQATPIGATPVEMPRPSTAPEQQKDETPAPEQQQTSALDQMNELEATAAARRDADDATGLTPFGGSNVEGRTTLLDWMTDAERERFHELRLSLPSSGQQQTEARARLAARRGTVVSTSPKKGLAIIARNRAARAEPDAQFELEQRGEVWAVVRRAAPNQAPAIETTAPEPTPAPTPDTTAAPAIDPGALFAAYGAANRATFGKAWSAPAEQIFETQFRDSLVTAGVPDRTIVRVLDEARRIRAERTRGQGESRFLDFPDVTAAARSLGLTAPVESTAPDATTTRVRTLQTTDAKVRLEGQWQRLMSDTPDDVAGELTPDDAREHLARLDAAPGDNPKARAVLTAILADATHTDSNDGTIERVTPEVIDDALDDSTLTNGRKWLLAKIQAARSKTADAELVEEYNRLTAEAAEARRQAGLKKTKPGAAKMLEGRANHIENNLLPDLRKRIGFVTFKVPGDGTFKVLNTPDKLDAFAKRVRATQAFTQVDTRKTKAQTDPYEQHETRPDTTDAQRTAGRNALRDLQRRVSARLDRQGHRQDGGALRLLASNLYDGLTLDGSVELTGQVVRSPADLAALAQVFRDPRFETFRVFYTDAAGKVVGEAAYTSRLPALVSLPKDIEARITADRDRFGATGYWVLHNHPSGSATPSEADIRLTRSVAKDAPGFLGHVVIDHNEYTTIDAAGRVNTVRAPELNGTDFHSAPELKHDLLGVTVNTPELAAKAAKALQIPGGHAGLIFTRRGGEVQLVMDVPAAALADHSPRGVKRMKAVVRAFARESGSGGLRFIVLPEGADPAPFARWVTRGVFTDVVAADGTTAEVAGAVWTGDFMDRGANTRQVREADAPPEETFPRKVQRVFQDKFNRFTVIQDWLKQRGITLTEQADVYRAEERMHGRTATRIEDFREKRVKPIIREIRRAGLKLADVADFLHAQHAEERNAQIARINSNMPDGGSGMSTADARAKLAQYGQNAELVRLANELRAITDDSRDMLLKAGIITQEMADAWATTYKHYVPLRGGPDTVRQGTGRGLTVKQQNKRALGHDTREEGEWIVENILQQHERAILQVEKNRVGQHLLKLALEAGHPDLITIDKPVRRQVLRDMKTYVVRYHGSVVESFHSLADAQRYVGQEALRNGRTRADFAIETSHDLDVVLMPSPVLEETETQVYVDGHAVRIQFKDEGLARAWNNLGAEHMNVVFRIARTANMWMSKAYTGYNPEFITTNIIRDAVTGIANITGEEGALFAAKAAANYPRAFAQLMRYVWTGNPSNWIAQYRADGGTTGAAYLSDLERIGADAEAAFLNYAGTVDAYRSGGPRKAARVAGTAALRVAVGWIEKLNQAGENAMRLAVYRTAVESGKSRAHAASLAKNATVNFNRRGEMGSTLGAMYLFFNPAVQGTAALAHALFKGAHRHQAQAITTGLVTLGYHLAAGMGGGPEDEWEKIPEFQRERNIHIWTGDGWARLPIPYGYGWFMTLGRQLHELERGEEASKVALRLASSFVSEFSVWGPAADDEGDEKNVMFLLPTLAQITMAPVLNRTSLGGPIYPEAPYDEGRPDNLKMWRATQGTVFADMAQGLNAVTGGSAIEKGWADVSPETLKFLWTTATGGAGKFFTDSAALVRNLAEGVEVESREVPIVRKFVQPAGDIRATRALFWEAATEVREAMDLLRRAKRVEDITERRELAQTVLHEKKELLALGKAMDRYIKAAAAKRDVVQATMADETKPLAWRRAAVKGIEKEEAALYDAFLELYRGTTK